jgi:hypothetical protein
LTAKPLKITQVTDPSGRTTTLPMTRLGGWSASRICWDCDPRSRTERAMVATSTTPYGTMRINTGEHSLMQVG